MTAQASTSKPRIAIYIGGKSRLPEWVPAADLYEIPMPAFAFPSRKPMRRAIAMNCSRGQIGSQALMHVIGRRVAER